MPTESKRAYLKRIKERYAKAGRVEKTKILDEFCSVCDYNRKYAIRLLKQRIRKKKRKPGPKPIYTGPCVSVLYYLWRVARYPCSERLKGIIPQWLPFYEQRYGKLLQEDREKLLAISIATIERLLKKKRGKRKGKCTTRPGTLLKHSIPIRLSFKDVEKPGYIEADTVAHCGESIAGDFIYSITFTDIYSQWTETQAIWNKGYEGTKKGIHAMEERLPFSMLGFDADGGSEFLNHHLIRYWKEAYDHNFELTRSRPSRPNDNAHVEQKNWTHVRKLLGYQRFDTQNLLPILNDIYTTWRLLHNFFYPNLKLIEKKRIGSKVRKKYDTAKTPYHRLLQANNKLFSEQQKEKLKEQYEQLNPITLTRELEQKITLLERATKLPPI